MKIFELPVSTEVNRVIPKNSFDAYASAKHRKGFSELVEKIRWANKLSFQTVNLEGADIKEIQVFQIELKQKAEISDLLDVIDRAVPYSIIFIVHFGGEMYLRAAVKHPHPANENVAVLDWVFCSDWLSADGPYELNLKVSLDAVWADFCRQLSGKAFSKIPIGDLIDYEERVAVYKRDISRLETALKKARQFNHKTEINIELQQKKSALKELELKYKLD